MRAPSNLTMFKLCWTLETCLSRWSILLEHPIGVYVRSLCLPYLTASFADRMILQKICMLPGPFFSLCHPVLWSFDASLKLIWSVRLSLLFALWVPFVSCYCLDFWEPRLYVFRFISVSHPQPYLHFSGGCGDSRRRGGDPRRQARVRLFSFDFSLFPPSICWSKLSGGVIRLSLSFFSICLVFFCVSIWVWSSDLVFDLMLVVVLVDLLLVVGLWSHVR